MKHNIDTMGSLASSANEISYDDNVTPSFRTMCLLNTLSSFIRTRIKARKLYMIQQVVSTHIFKKDS